MPVAHHQSFPCKRLVASGLDEPLAPHCVIVDVKESLGRKIRHHGSSAGLAAPLMPFGDLTKVMGFEEVWEFDRRHAETP